MTLQERIESPNMTTEQLQNCALGLWSNFENGATEAFVAVLDELEKRMTETDFVAFCDENF